MFMFGVMHNGNNSQEQLHTRSIQSPSIDESLSITSIATFETTDDKAKSKTPKHMPLPKQYPPVGFKNWGNTCYANASLQCLMSTALSRALLEPKFFYSFSSSVVSNYNIEEDNEDPAQEQKRDGEIPKSELCRWITNELTKLCKEYASSNQNNTSSNNSYNNFLIKFGITSNEIVIDPGNITRNVTKLSNCFTQGRQEDAHEFLRALISTLVMDGFNKQLSSLFDGLLESSVTCTVCNNCSIRRDRYMDLSLEISDGCIRSLYDALSHFTKTEMLSKDNMVECPKCEKRRPVSKGLRLATAPTILVCHLKRFMYDKYGRINRVSKSIEFPLLLDIGNYMSDVNRSIPPLYELVGVLVHQGQTCYNGHYISYVKSGEEWYRVSDNHVVQVELDYVMQQKAYILMYEVQGMRNHKIPYSLSGISRTFSNSSTNDAKPSSAWRSDSQIEKIHSIVDPCEIFSFLCTNSCFGLNNQNATNTVDHTIIHDYNNMHKTMNKEKANKNRENESQTTTTSKSTERPKIAKPQLLSQHQRSNSLTQCEEHHKEMLRRHQANKEKNNNANSNHHRRARSLSRSHSSVNANASDNQNGLSRSAHGYTYQRSGSCSKQPQVPRRTTVNPALPPRPVRSTSRTSY